MTANELISHLNNTYGIDKEWPKTYEVDAETYANCCQFRFNKYEIHEILRIVPGSCSSFQIYLGKNRGLMIKNTELIFKDFKL